MASSPARAVSGQAPVALAADLPFHLSASLPDGLAAGDGPASSSLAAALAAVPDARRRRGRRHELTELLTIAACACLTGARSTWRSASGPLRRGLRCSSAWARPRT